MKAYCHKSNDDPFGMKFKKGEVYNYYISPRGIFVLIPAPSPFDFDYHCGYDEDRFKETFYTEQEYRKFKLEKIMKKC